MLTRIPVRPPRPWIWILRPRGVAAMVAVLAAFSTSSAFAQRGGGCSGSSGGTGGGTGTSSGTSSAGLASVAGIASSAAFQDFAAHQMAVQNQQAALYSIPTGNMYSFDYPPVFNHQEYLAERRAFRAAQAEARQRRLAAKGSSKARPERLVTWNRG